MAANNASQPIFRESQAVNPTADWIHGETRTNGVHLHYVFAGQGEPVVLLHGFPEFWYSWRHQLPALADAGFRAIAPDLRGYNQSSRPAGVKSYRIAALTNDLVGLVEQVAGGSAVVVGHDWGGVLAWRLATLHPSRVRKLVILNAPHPAAFRDELRNHLGQWLRSLYVLFFQAPWLPEWVLRARNFALLERIFQEQPVRSASFTHDDIAAYKHALSGPRGLSSPLNYYRAAMRYPRDLYEPPQSVAAPTLVIWGCCDPFLNVRLVERLPQWVSNLRIERLPEISHWVQNDAPEQVNQLLLDFLAEKPLPHGAITPSSATTSCLETWAPLPHPTAPHRPPKNSP